MMTEAARPDSRGAALAPNGRGLIDAERPRTRFALANYTEQHYGDTTIAYYTLLISQGAREGVKVISYNESRVIINFPLGQVVHVHKSPVERAFQPLSWRPTCHHRIQCELINSAWAPLTGKHPVRAIGGAGHSHLSPGRRHGRPPGKKLTPMERVRGGLHEAVFTGETRSSNINSGKPADATGHRGSIVYHRWPNLTCTCLGRATTFIR
jgi:hypothetical protein